MKAENSATVNYPDLGTTLLQVSLDTTLTLLVTPNIQLFFSHSIIEPLSPLSIYQSFFFFLNLNAGLHIHSYYSCPISRHAE